MTALYFLYLTGQIPLTCYLDKELFPLGDYHQFSPFCYAKILFQFHLKSCLDLILRFLFLLFNRKRKRRFSERSETKLTPIFFCQTAVVSKISIFVVDNWYWFIFVDRGGSRRKRKHSPDEIVGGAASGNNTSSSSDENSSPIDPVSDLYAVLEGSALIPFLESKLQANSFLEICNHSSVYRCVINIIRELGK